MYETTLCLPVRCCLGGAVLLGLKKRGFGQGYYTGFGGKVEPGETILAAAVRELAEESGLVAEPPALIGRGTLTFCFPAKPAWDQQVHLFLVERWSGRPVETGEMAPAWFPLSQLPYDRMWSDARYWLPPVLAGQVLAATITFAADNTAIDRVVF